jgi:hypothetical protein
MTVRTALALTAIPAVLLLSCGGSPARDQAEAAPAAEAAAAPTTDFCALLTAEEVQAAVGWAVAKSTVYGQGNLGHCKYEGEKSNNVLPPEQLEAGVIMCFTNFPCAEDMPGSFASSADLVAYRKKLYAEYEKDSSMGPLDASIEPVEGLGVPAIMHELGGQYTLEAWLGPKRIAYVSVWTSADAARSLGEQVLARAR